MLKATRGGLCARSKMTWSTAMPNFPNRDASGTPSERMVVVTVAGKLNDAAFQRAKKAAEFLADAEGEFTANVVSLLPIDYELFVQGILPAFPDVREHDGAVLCYLGEPNGGATYLGHLDPFMAWCRETYDYEDETDEDIYARLAETHMRGLIEKTGREYVTMEVCADGAVEGTLLIELFTDIAPKTCANFRAFALGEEEKTAGRTYEGCPVHRVVPRRLVSDGRRPRGERSRGDERVRGHVRGRDVQGASRYTRGARHGWGEETHQRLSILTSRRRRCRFWTEGGWGSAASSTDWGSCGRSTRRSSPSRSGPCETCGSGSARGSPRGWRVGAQPPRSDSVVIGRSATLDGWGDVVSMSISLPDATRRRCSSPR